MPVCGATHQWWWPSIDPDVRDVAAVVDEDQVTALQVLARMWRSEWYCAAALCGSDPVDGVHEHVAHQAGAVEGVRAGRAVDVGLALLPAASCSTLWTFTS